MSSCPLKYQQTPEAKGIYGIFSLRGQSKDSQSMLIFCLPAIRIEYYVQLKRAGCLKKKREKKSVP